MDAINAAGVSPVIAFSFKDAETWSLLANLVEVWLTETVFNNLTSNKLTNAVELHGGCTLFWVAVIGTIIIEVEAISYIFR